MQTYLKYKNEILGFEDVAKTVKSTEKIAASHIHFLKQTVQNLNSYTQAIAQLLARLGLFYQKNNQMPLLRKKRGEKIVLIVSGDKGLVGGLYHNLIKAFLGHQPYQKIVVVGKKGESYLKENNCQISNVFSFSSYLPSVQDIQLISDYLFGEFHRPNTAQIDILYPRFVSLSIQEPHFIQFLPFSFNLETNSENQRFSQEELGFPLFEPSKKKLFIWLIKKYVEVFFYKIILEAKLSEFSARTVITEHATLKTQELIRKTKLSYFKERRKAITQKQLESFVVHRVQR